MPSDAPSGVALLPIKPRYAAAIIRGDKRVEFRRRRFARAVDYVVIYASSPLKRVLGYFRVSGIVEGDPAEIWQRYRDVAGIEEEAYCNYYADADVAVAIEIDQLHVLATPVPLPVVDQSLSPPQSYVYLDREVLGRLARASVALGVG